MAIATCHTQGCGNADVPIDVGTLQPSDPDAVPPTPAEVHCGACGQQISDITEP